MPKVSINIPEELMQRIEDYRRKQKRIPTLTQAIIQLLEKALKGEE